MKPDFALEIIAKTQADYNRMAGEFSRTRGSLPQDVRDLQQYIVKGEKVLDLGCGNGRFSELFDAEDYTGADISEALIAIAKEKHPTKKFITLDPFSSLIPHPSSFPKWLPFPDHHFDKVFCLAVIHHIPSRQLRQEFIREISRVLKPGGTLILTAWYLLDKPNIRRELLKQALRKLIGRNKLDLGDIIIPFRNNKGEVLAERYIHVFSVREMKKAVEGGGLSVEGVGLVTRGRNQNIEVVAQLH